jgi:hypothetical protein
MQRDFRWGRERGTGPGAHCNVVESWKMGGGRFFILKFQTFSLRLQTMHCVLNKLENIF